MSPDGEHRSGSGEGRQRQNILLGPWGSGGEASAASKVRSKEAGTRERQGQGDRNS